MSGICAGMVGTLISHPLDTVKVRIQLSKVGSRLTVRQCLKDIYRVEGATGFFKGVWSPIVARTPISACLFVS